MKEVLVIDNYDSFTYNIVYQLKQLGCRVTVWRNDAFSLNQVGSFHHIVLSPGPGIPSEAGLMPALLQNYATEKKILGICLGHQAIGEFFGARLKNLSRVFHGIQTKVFLDAADPIFEGLGSAVSVGRYHSWVVDKSSLPDSLQCIAQDEQGYVMALRHTKCDVLGLQFHPESVLTPQGIKILENWLS